jgi:hypothetical protein
MPETGEIFIKDIDLERRSGEYSVRYSLEFVNKL